MLSLVSDDGVVVLLVDVSLRVKHEMVFRPGSPPVELRKIECSSQEEGDYTASILSTPTHIGTHVDIVYPDKKIDLRRFIGVGRLIDVSGIIDRAITLEDFKTSDIGKGDFVFIKTDWDQYLGNDKYFDHPELSMEAVRWLASKQINMVGIDALGLGKLKDHGAYDKFLVDKDIYIIENLTNLSSLDKPIFKVYCFPLSIEECDALPARIIAET